MSGAAVWDAVVVGAGPAGSATAARLSRSGYRVLLLDRDRFPRDKPCGECLNPAAVGALSALGALPRIRAESHAVLEGWRILSPGGGAFAGTFPETEKGIGIRRSVLDRLLAEHAAASGAELRAGARVVDLVREDGRVAGVRLGRRSGGEEIRARLVVGADGLRSVLVRRLELIRRPPRLRKIALTAHVRGLPGLEGRGELHVRPWGCIGVAEVGAGLANVTVVVGGDEAEHVAGEREEYFDDALAGEPRFAGAERAGPVLSTGPFDWPTRSAVADGALLVGDAAGYYDPFTGQGIYRALRGAELAAAVAEEALRRDDTTAAALAPYERARRRAFLPGQRLQRVIEAFVARPRLMDWAAGRFRRRPEVADALIAVTGDLRPVRSLLDPALLVRLVR